MDIEIKSKAHRILHPLTSFKVLEEWGQLKQLTEVASPLHVGETLLGVYENHAGQIEQIVIFTDIGIYIHESSGWLAARYSDVSKAECRETKKEEMSEIVLSLGSRKQINLPILGGNGRFRDAFQVLRFFDRVTKR